MELTAEHLEKMQEFIRKVHESPIRGDVYYTLSIEQNADQEAFNAALDKIAHRASAPASVYQAVGQSAEQLKAIIEWRIAPHPLCPPGYLIPKWMVK